MMKKLMHLGFLGSDGAELVRKLAAMDGETLSNDEVQEMQAFIECDQYTMDVDQNSQIRWMIEAVDMLLSALGQRHWAV